MKTKVIGLAIRPDAKNSERILRESLPEAEFKTGHGIVGDAKAGRENRQVNLISKRTYDWFARNYGRERELPGGFGENIVVDGPLDLNWLDNDAMLKIGEVTLKVLWPRTPCEIMAGKADVQKVDILNGRVGIFCSVVEGGTVRVGDEVCLQK